METKKCPKCNINKPINEFAKSYKRPGGYSSWCKLCHKTHTKKATNLVMKRYRDQCQEIFMKLKAQYACSNCGESHIATLDFHHLDPKEKDVNVSNLKYSKNQTKLLNELDKCICLCSNCHRKLHYTLKNE